MKKNILTILVLTLFITISCNEQSLSGVYYLDKKHAKRQMKKGKGMNRFMAEAIIATVKRLVFLSSNKVRFDMAFFPVTVSYKTDGNRLIAGPDHRGGYLTFIIKDDNTLIGQGLINGLIFRKK